MINKYFGHEGIYFKRILYLCMVLFSAFLVAMLHFGIMVVDEIDEAVLADANTNNEDNIDAAPNYTDKFEEKMPRVVPDSPLMLTDLPEMELVMYFEGDNQIMIEDNDRFARINSDDNPALVCRTVAGQALRVEDHQIRTSFLNPITGRSDDPTEGRTCSGYLDATLEDISASDCDFKFHQSSVVEGDSVDLVVSSQSQILTGFTAIFALGDGNNIRCQASLTASTLNALIVDFSANSNLEVNNTPLLIGGRQLVKMVFRLVDDELVIGNALDVVNSGESNTLSMVCYVLVEDPVESNSRDVRVNLVRPVNQTEEVTKNYTCSGWLQLTYDDSGVRGCSIDIDRFDPEIGAKAETIVSSQGRGVDQALALVIGDRNKFNCSAKIPKDLIEALREEIQPDTGQMSVAELQDEFSSTNFSLMEMAWLFLTNGDIVIGKKPIIEHLNIPGSSIATCLTLFEEPWSLEDSNLAVDLIKPSNFNGGHICSGFLEAQLTSNLVWSCSLHINLFTEDVAEGSQFNDISVSTSNPLYRQAELAIVLDESRSISCGVNTSDES